MLLSNAENPTPPKLRGKGLLPHLKVTREQFVAQFRGLHLKGVARQQELIRHREGNLCLMLLSKVVEARRPAKRRQLLRLSTSYQGQGVRRRIFILSKVLFLSMCKLELPRYWGNLDNPAYPGVPKENLTGAPVPHGNKAPR